VVWADFVRLYFDDVTWNFEPYFDSYANFDSHASFDSNSNFDSYTNLDSNANFESFTNLDSNANFESFTNFDSNANFDWASPASNGGPGGLAPVGEKIKKLQIAWLG
jgi:hypothetical protein